MASAREQALQRRHAPEPGQEPEEPRLLGATGGQRMPVTWSADPLERRRIARDRAAIEALAGDYRPPLRQPPGPIPIDWRAVLGLQVETAPPGAGKE